MIEEKVIKIMQSHHREISCIFGISYTIVILFLFVGRYPLDINPFTIFIFIILHFPVNFYFCYYYINEFLVHAGRRILHVHGESIVVTGKSFKYIVLKTDSETIEKIINAHTNDLSYKLDFKLKKTGGDHGKER